MKMSNEQFGAFCFVVVCIVTFAALAFAPTRPAQCKLMCPENYVPHLSADGECSCTSDCTEAP
jgi:hypothetical protein